MTAATLDFGFLDKIPDQDLNDIVAALKSGDQAPGCALGFDEPALVTLEQMALSYYRGKKHKEAGLIFAFVLRMDPKRNTSWRGLGACAQARHDLTLAAFCYEMALIADPDDVVSQVYLGECLCRVGKTDDGLPILEAAVAAAGDKVELKPYVIRARGILQARGGVPSRVFLSQKALEVVAEAEKQSGAAPEYEYHPESPLTVEEMKRHPELKPLIKDLTALLAKGRTTLAEIGGFTDKELNGAYAVAVRFTEGKQFPQALQLAGFLMLVDPYKARYYQLAGICFQNLKQYGEANHCYTLALALEKDEPRTLVYQGETRIMMGEIDEGVALVKQGVAAAGKNHELADVVKRGQVLVKQFGR